MKVESLKISKVFSGGGEIHYVLPQFQREYAWELTNWRTLLEDIFSIYEVYDSQNEPEHFLGALVVISDGNRSGTIPAFKLVDGQQRLTTISLALCALGSLVEKTHPSVYKKIRRMLENEDETDLVRYKLLPTEKYGDRAVYKSIIDGKPRDGSQKTESRIDDAFTYLYDQLSKRLMDGIDPERLFLVIANCLQVVFIDLDQRERPYEIFESLNAKGKELTQPDLIRNFIAMMLPEKQQDRAFQSWSDIENKLRESRRVSRIGELTAFLRHYLAYRSGVLPNKDHVYARFRDRVQRTVGQDANNFIAEIDDLHRFATYYDRFLRPQNESDTDIRRALERLKVIESSTAYPFLLSLFEDHYRGQINRHDLLGALAVIENYLTRRFLANEPSNYTNKMFPTLSRELALSNLVSSLQAALLKRNYPSDTQIRAVLPTLSLYANNTRERLIFLLSEINQYLSKGTDGYTTLIGDATIEHLMPQKLSAEWKSNLGANWEETYRDLCDTLGNLTLVTQSWNSALSNSPWSEKKPKLAKHALLINSSYFKADSQKQWNADAIRVRSNWLAENALQIWKSYGEPPATMSFSGRIPQSLIIMGEQHDVSSWRDVAIQVLEFAIGWTKDDFKDFVADLQTAYLSTTEKTRSRQLSNGWWLYVNLSADTVMNLCSRAMELMGLEDDDWEIKIAEN